MMMECNAETAYYFLLGNPVTHSLSPLIYNTGFRLLNINAVYLAAAVEATEISNAVKGLKALAAGGCNITSPYKEMVIPCIDQVDEDAKICNSVNTIVNKEGFLCGSSTDGKGFYHALLKADPGYSPNKPALLIGAGGSARAVAYHLAKKGLKELYLANRNPENAETLAALLFEHTSLDICHCLPLDSGRLKAALDACHLIVYCLPLDADEVVKALHRKEFNGGGKIFFDLRYSPAETEVMKSAAGANAITHNGIGLLFRQALLAFKLFTGQAAPEEEIESALARYRKKELLDGSF